jgi:hypothetical protein
VGATVKDEDVIVVGSIPRENVAVTEPERATKVDPSAGVTATTVGPATVVKLHDNGAPSGVPSDAAIDAANVAV